MMMGVPDSPSLGTQFKVTPPGMLVDILIPVGLAIAAEDPVIAINKATAVSVFRIILSLFGY